MFLLLLAVLLVVVPIAELWVIIQVSHVIGGWETLALLLVESLFGAWLLKRQGVAVLRRIDSQLRQHQLPHRELVDGFLILLAGALMLAPGFITDVLGFLLLLPPTRALVRRAALHRFRSRLGLGWLGGLVGANRAPDDRSGRRVWVDSTVVDASASGAPGSPRAPGASGPASGGTGQPGPPPDRAELPPGRY